jgi:septum formation inhibitor-activating ATPase MinD
MQNLVSALTNLNFQYIFMIARWIDVGFINAISPAKEALFTTSELPAMRDADRVGVT